MKILVPSAEGIVERQWISALRGLGHDVFSHAFNPYGTGNNRPSLVRMVEENEIEVILSFDDDSEATLLGICNDCRIKLAIWHHDAPYKFLLPAWYRQYRHIHHFCMDRYYVDIMRGAGYDTVGHLPLGTTPAVFSPAGKTRADFTAQVGFVANLHIQKAHDQWGLILKDWHVGDEEAALVRGLIGIAAHRGIDIPGTITLFQDKGLPLPLVLLIIKFVETVASQERRKGPVLALRDLVDLKVVGSDWDLVGAYRHQILPRIEYYRELPVFYRSAAINLNITQPQIRYGLNQRFYDVLACEGFLISDHNDEIAPFFTPGEELVLFDGVPDLVEKVGYYLHHPDQRRAIARAARKKVLAHHTMRHRMEEVTRILQGTPEERGTAAPSPRGGIGIGSAGP